MSAITYSEPYKLPAGILALAVHAAFLALLYFGISWQTQPPQGMVVDIWDKLPAPETAPAKVEPPVEKAEPPKPVVPPKLVEPVLPVVPPKADIELAKKKQQVKPVEVKKPVELKQPLKATKPVEKPQPAVPKLSEAEQAEQSARAEQALARAAQDAAVGKVIDEYKAKIQSKIKRNINIADTQGVAKDARAEFLVTLLPGGTVLNVKPIKKSGNAAWDSAVERAIWKSQPLPLPPDVALFRNFREFTVGFSPGE